MKRISLLAVAALAAGCASEPRIVEKEVPVTPPAWMTAPCPDQNHTVELFGDLIPAATAYRAERDYCAYRMDRLRWWLQQVDTPES